MNVWKDFPMFLGSILALVALAAGLINSVEPTQCLIRGGICYLVGSFTAALWNMFFATPPKVAFDPPETEQSSDHLQQIEPQESTEAA